jgi:hypothetical protein
LTGELCERGPSDFFVKVTIGVVLNKLRQGRFMKLGQHG